MNDMNIRGKKTFISMLSLLALAQVACTTADGKEWTIQPSPTDESEDIAEASSAITGSHKMCSAVVSGKFRDTIVVPSAWNSGNCQQWVASVGGTSWQLGCLHDTGHSWGTSNGGIPPTNCNW